jgi:hypothetical protein
MLNPGLIQLHRDLSQEYRRPRRRKNQLSSDCGVLVELEAIVGASVDSG